MKSVGQQLQEARQAKNWTPELAARETKIKVERVRDLEADDYSHFSSPTYARGFVRTYARALGLDEYRLLRQLDNKLPEDDNASFAQDNGLPYVPETSKPAMHVSSAPRTGLYIVLGLGAAVVFVITFVMFQAYRAGELQRYFADNSSESLTNAAPSSALDSQTPPKAMAVDPNDTTHAAKALPVDLNALAASGAPAAPAAPATGTTTTAPVAVAVSANLTPVAVAPAVTTPISPAAPPITPAPSTNTDTVNLNPAATTDTNTIVSATPPAVAPSATTNVVLVPAATNVTVAPAPAPAETAPPHEKRMATTSSARASNAGAISSAPVEPVAPPPHAAPRALPVDPSVLMAANQNAPQASTIPATPTVPPVPQPEVTTAVDLGNGAPGSAPAFVDARAPKRLVLTASHDSFIRVTSLDTADKQVLYTSVLHTGQSIAFDGRKFSVSVNNPSAVDIELDGVDYGPHSDNSSPETFTLQSHQQ